MSFTEMGTMWWNGRVIQRAKMDSSVLDIAMSLKKSLDNVEHSFECRYLGSQEKQG